MDVLERLLIGLALTMTLGCSTEGGPVARVEPSPKEHLAIGPGTKVGTEDLYVGDIGDNARVRRYVTLYRVPEPSVEPSTHSRPSSSSTPTVLTTRRP